MTTESKKQNFYEQMIEINKGIINGSIDESVEKLRVALNEYEDNHLKCFIPNVFNKASNVIEAAVKRALFLEQLNRIIEISKRNNLKDSMGVYYRYYALAQSFYGAPERGLEIIREAENLLEENTGIFIELRNAKGLIYSELKLNDKALEVFLENYQRSQDIDYLPGYRFVHNIGSAYKDLGAYERSVTFFEDAIEYELSHGYIVSAVDAMIELAEVYIKIKNFEKAFEILERSNRYPVLTQNLFLYKSYSELMYILLKEKEHYKEALDYHEILMSLEIQMNMDRYSGMITELNMKYDLDEKEKEYALIKNKNNDLEMMSKKLENMNQFLQNTLEKSRSMQEVLKKKNDELESTMASLNMTQEKLLLAEKRTVLDEMFINIAHHMNTPLGVMNTTISHMDLLIKKTDKSFMKGLLTKNHLHVCIEDIKEALKLLVESMEKVVGFVDTLRLYKSDDEEKAIEINLNRYFKTLLENYKKTKDITKAHLDCPEDIYLTINVSLLSKCIDMISNKLIATSCTNTFDIEVSKEINMVSIGLGDFGPCEVQVEEKLPLTIVDTYDFYIIETIVENLMGGRFIKFEDRGRDYFQFIFYTESDNKKHHSN
jgi:tetratricopeptide (TPR) repeat protein